MRNVYNPKYKLNRLTQGSIISNCILSGYPNADVSGLIITPRCDMDHEIKVNTIHYLPIIPLSQWMEYEGINIIYTRIKKEVKNALNEEIKRKKKVADNFLSSNLADRQTIEEIFPKPNDNQSTLIKLHFEHTQAQFKEYIQKKPKTINCLSDLIDGNRISHLYIIEDWNNPEEYQVIFLREIHQISRDVALRLNSGLVSDEQDSLFFQNNALARPEKGTTFEYKIIAEINSPIIEHIMQHFSHHFTRIGVEDRTKVDFNKYI